MIKHILLGMMNLLVLSAAGCGEVPPATSANSQSALTAFPAPCQTLPAGQAANFPHGIPDTGSASATPCDQIFLPAILSAVQSSAFCPAIQNGLTYLMARYNPALGLLNEAPVAAPHTYWLTNDNALAAYAFAQLGQADLSATIKKSILLYGSDTNGLIEVVWGLPVSFPPHDATQVLLQTIGGDEIYQEFHDRGEIFNDWAEYADLGFYGALNEFHQGDLTAALSTYAGVLELYDGAGFHDAAFKGSYATYKLALALYTGAILQAPNPNREQMLATLLSMQAPNGGFRTDYTDLQTPQGDTNTETSALALLALAAGGCNP